MTKRSQDYVKDLAERAEARPAIDAEVVKAAREEAKALPPAPTLAVPCPECGAERFQPCRFQRKNGDGWWLDDTTGDLHASRHV